MKNPLIGQIWYDSQNNKCLIRKVADSYSELGESCEIAEEMFKEGLDPNQTFVWVELMSSKTHRLEGEFAYPLIELCQLKNNNRISLESEVLRTLKNEVSKQYPEIEESLITFKIVEMNMEELK